MLACQTVVFCLCKDQMTFAASFKTAGRGERLRKDLSHVMVIYHISVPPGFWRFF